MDELQLLQLQGILLDNVVELREALKPVSAAELDAVDGFFDLLLPVTTENGRVARTSSVCLPGSCSSSGAGRFSSTGLAGGGSLASCGSGSSLASLASASAPVPRIVVVSADATSRSLILTMLTIDHPTSAILGVPSIDESISHAPDVVVLHVSPRTGFAGDAAALPQGPDGATGYVLVGDFSPDMEEMVRATVAGGGWVDTVRARLSAASAARPVLVCVSPSHIGDVSPPPQCAASCLSGPAPE